MILSKALYPFIGQGAFGVEGEMLGQLVSEEKINKNLKFDKNRQKVTNRYVMIKNIEDAL